MTSWRLSGLIIKISRLAVFTFRCIAATALTIGLALAPPCFAQGATEKPQVAPADPADAETLDACERTSKRVFVNTVYGRECIGYFAAGLDLKSRVAVLHFHGDFGDDILIKSERGIAMARGLQARADRSAKRFGIPYIYVARPGLINSTGDHKLRRGLKEFHSLSSAVDKIKERYGFETIAVAGQSGGGSVVGALLTLGRTDIMCAAPGSGAFDVVGLYRLRATLAGRTVTDQQIENYRRLKYSPIDNISGVFKNDARRIFVVGDPRDKNTFFEQQRDFAYRLKAAMHHAVLLYAPGAGAKRHSVGHVADEVAGLCMQGKTDSEIEQAMSKWWQREFTTPAAKTGDGAPNQFSNAAALKAPLTFEAPLAIPGRAR